MANDVCSAANAVGRVRVAATTAPGEDSKAEVRVSNDPVGLSFLNMVKIRI
jgi:hypothetical protein